VFVAGPDCREAKLIAEILRGRVAARNPGGDPQNINSLL